MPLVTESDGTIRFVEPREPGDPYVEAADRLWDGLPQRLAKKGAALRAAQQMNAPELAGIDAELAVIRRMQEMLLGRKRDLEYPHDFFGGKVTGINDVSLSEIKLRQQMQDLFPTLSDNEIAKEIIFTRDEIARESALSTNEE